MEVFERTKRLPPYVFSLTSEFKQQAAARGMKIIDFSMGNPDQPTPAPIVDSLREAALLTQNHRYSSSGGIEPLRSALCRWYQRRFDVALDPLDNTVVTLGSKEGLAHLMLAIASEGDVALVPTPHYPIHHYGFVLAGAHLVHIPLLADDDHFAAAFCQRMVSSLDTLRHGEKYIVLNFPANPSGHCVDLDFFTEMVAIAKRYQATIIHDFAYAELGFDDYQPPSILQVPGAIDVAVESYSLSKSYNMPGWRVGFISGNPRLVAALRHIKTYLDYGLFAPLEYAAVVALDQGDEFLPPIRLIYQRRRDALCQALNGIGWQVTPPKATMFLWAKIPTAYQNMGSLEFSRYLIDNSGVAVSPGIGFGEDADDHVRFAFIEDETAVAEAATNLNALFAKDGVTLDDLAS